MYFRKLSAPALQRVTVSAFPGLDRRCGAPQGSFTQMENLCPDSYPALAVRRSRGYVAKLENCGGMTARECLVWVEGQTLYVNSLAVGPVLLPGEKQFVSMGAYLVIFPDKVWINLRDMSSFGSLDNTVRLTGQVSFALCRSDGSLYGAYTAADEAPADAAEGELWLDTSGGKPVLLRYAQEIWSEVADVCVKMQAAGIGAGFSAGDGVDLTGCAAEGLDGRHVLRLVHDDALVIDGAVAGDSSRSGEITVSRTAPEMDFVTECGNRLWGCKYGVVNGRAVNEIYASKLGDFRNWNCYAGLSTDSYAASRGSDGPFTAAVSFLGSVLFCKENCIERLYPAASGAHQVVTLECPGVLHGSSKTVAAVDGTLYYLGRGGVYAFDGSLPVPVSAALGDMHLSGGAAGGLEGKYYLSAREGAAQHLLVYDSRRRLWYREDDLAVRSFAALDGELYALSETGDVLALGGSRGEAETQLPWQAVTAPLGLESAAHQYPVRLTLAMTLAQGSRVEAALSYDGGKTWHAQGGMTGRGGAETVTLHLRPRRCAQVQLRLQGTGRCTVHAVSAVYEKGSDET